MAEIFRSKTALGALEDRLRRLLGLSGEIGAKLSPDLAPVLHAGSTLDTGLSSFFNRRFAISPIPAIVAASFGWVLKFPVAVRLDCFSYFFQNVASSGISVWLLDPTTAPVNAAAVQAGTWVDNKTLPSATEKPPILISAENAINLAGEAAPTSQTALIQASGSGNGGVLIQPLDVYLAAGTHLIIRVDNTGGNRNTFALFGRIAGA